ncbi:MAG TPA: Ig-like domain-containing protein, partial [Spirochaetota bacterium]|nr:Ig-like domain-containing protein [Spirochaetota bacterium]
MSGNNSNKKRSIASRRTALLRGLLFIPVILAFLISCSGGSPTVIPAEITQTNPTETSGTLIPQISMVYPTSTGVAPSNPGIVIVFTRPMENDLTEMTTALELRDGTTIIPCTLSPSFSSSAFSLKPSSPLLQNHTYTIHISKYCAENDYPTHTLDITNLPKSITATATTTDYVEYQFTTGTTSYSDTTAPTFGSCTPADGDTDVPPTLTAGSGYISFTLNDNATPMIDPSTVNPATVVLYNVTDGKSVDGSIEVIGLTDFETY